MENVRLKIIDFDYKGGGVAKLDNKTVFLDGGVIGDVVEAEILEDKKRFFTARVLSVLKDSPYRIKSKCNYSGVCGGCDFLEFDYKEQLKWKREKVTNDLRRIGSIDGEVKDTLGMKTPYYYRNNIQLKVLDGKLGYYKKNTKELVEVSRCIIAKDEINNFIRILRTWKGIKSVDEVSIRENYRGEIMAVFISSKGVKNFNTLLPKIVESNVVSVFENINRNRKVRFGREFKKLYGSDYLNEELLGMKFKLSPRSFFQVNLLQTEKLYNVALKSLKLEKKDRLLDLYCGIGTISLLAADKVKEVVGVEVVEDAVEDARLNAKLNNITNSRFICGKSEDVLHKLYENNSLYFNKIVLDPPRTGLDKSLINTLLKLGADKIAYISCNPSTQSRDLKLLSEDYKVELIQPVDMFCNSVHVENVVLLQRNK
ncbi:23S rRNA (uracil(1939)-C(5))-methyltransferase RlmD [Anaerosphaera multitolerans]|uniref:23S rRNA (Uracil(1939)-C(5))-methyltransferase RlmD n=1 Tax=Anaerosphaera multitolerans TaxID=2487351 RepID=A0A437S683_9FIRM|nr:23S rRNA (uracil(1939)-C(5))-methyltransferase RlmD [Anaerosphaera multitolerans]RVU54535.1 23S rRNA (uracil(1939)-C(5))-methyltransferase RlmD [Anaerosphaera multitolerans]